jgi:Mn2+/Fe2+ NRAMP family transporter
MPMADVQESNDDLAAIEQEKAYLRELAQKPLPGRLKGYVALSGPGWLQSAITLGGGSLTGSLYLGVLAGFSMLWLQPLAMVMGIIMLSAIGYVTLSTGERPLRAINKHVNPVLGWSWLAASLMANMVWALPQYSLATGVLQQNLLPELLGSNGSLGDQNSKILIAVCILVITTAVTWSYGSGHWGVRLYERMLKCLVGLIVLTFMGVVVRMAMSEQGVNWGEFFGGFVPDFSSLFRPAEGFAPYLDKIVVLEHRQYWTDLIVNKQRDVLMTAFATAVGINMTFLLPYSMLGRGWGREHRGLSIFDLSTGMFIPFVLATSCVVIASANQFHLKPQPGLVGAASAAELSASAKQKSEFEGMLSDRYKHLIRQEQGAETATWDDAQWQTAIEHQRERAATTDAERNVAAMLVTRDAQELSASLVPLLQSKLFANMVFGLGVLGMALSTITILMLISGFVVCEVLDLPATGWPHRLGCLLAATGALGPFFWGKASFWLAVPTSVFGLVLLPIAYSTFLLLINQKSLLGDSMPRGAKRLGANLLMGLATGIAMFASGWAIWAKTGYWGVIGIAAFIGLATFVHVVRKPEPQESEH